MWIVKYLPKKLLSRFIGIVAYIPLPYPLSYWLVSIYIRFTGADPEEAVLPAKSYPSIGEFFIRQLKPGSRPLEGDIVSPIDGLLRSSHTISDGMLHQVKGITYSTAELLGDGEYAALFEQGMCFNFYLSPKDYHHVHVPIAGTLEHAKLLTGTLWPVNDWSFSRIEGLFAKNERIVFRFRTARGPVAVIMVGALNVGSMRVSFDPELKSPGTYPSTGKSFQQDFSAGDLLGTFRLGSSVLVIFTENAVTPVIESLPMPVRLGNALAR